MCFDERNTLRRGRPLAARLTWRRTRVLRRLLVIFCFDMTIVSRRLLLFAFLAEDEFIGVLHALALVGLRRTPAADFGRHLTDPLDVDAGDDDLGRLRRRDRDALRNREHHVVAVTERELQ